MGFRTGNAISLMQRPDLHPVRNIVDASTILVLSVESAPTCGVSGTKDTVRTKAVMLMGGHALKAATKYVVSTINDLGREKESEI